MQITDSAKDGLPRSLSASAFERINKVVRKGEAEAESQPDDSVVALNTSVFKDAKTAAISQGYTSLGSGFYRKAHSLWSMEKSGSGYALMRLADEQSPELDDSVQVAPNPLEVCASDRLGVPVEAGSTVHYSLGGTPVQGKVLKVNKTASTLSIKVGDQVDDGVPSQFVMVDRKAQLEDPGHDSLIEDNHEVGVEKPSVEDVVQAHFASYGAVLADELIALPKSTVAKLNRMATKTTRTASLRRIASTDALKQMSPKYAQVVHWIQRGFEARKASKVLNAPLALTYELSDLHKRLKTRATRALLWHLKEAEALHPDDVSVRKMVASIGYQSTREAAVALDRFRAQECLLQRKLATDQTAEEYWTEYFGDYGKTWVSEVKRRVRANLIRNSLKVQGVDSTAVDYWENYLGTYGKALCDQVDRASDQQEVKPQRVAVVKVEGGEVIDQGIFDHIPKQAGIRVVAQVEDGPDWKAKMRARLEKEPLWAPPAPKRYDIFAGTKPLVDFSHGNDRVALVANGRARIVLLRKGGVHRRETFLDADVALERYNTYLKSMR